MSSSLLHLDAIVLPLIRGKTVLDSGGGLGRWGALIETSDSEAGRDALSLVDGFVAIEADTERRQSRGFYRGLLSGHHDRIDNGVIAARRPG